MRRQLTAPLLALYHVLQKSGILEHEAAYALFVRSYFLYKRFLEDPFALLAKHYPDVFRNGHILDVGANVGYTAMVFHKAADSGFKVFAFEAEERNVRALEATIERLGVFGRIMPVCAAVGNRDGLTELWINTAHPTDHRIVTPDFVPPDGSRGRVVRCVTIDEFLSTEGIRQPISFIKIDVQGSELSVCEGMTDTLAANPRAVVAVEYGPEVMKDLGFDPEKLLSFFRDRNYFIYLIARNGALHAFDEARQRNMVEAAGYVDLLCSQRSL